MELLTNKTSVIVYNTPEAKQGYINFRLEWNRQNNPIYYGRVWFLQGETQKTVYVKNIIETLRDTQFITDKEDNTGATNVFNNIIYCYSIESNKRYTLNIDLWQLPMNESVTKLNSIWDYGYAPLEKYVSEITTLRPMLPCVPTSYPVYLSSVVDEGTVYAAKIEDKFYFIGKNTNGTLINSICKSAIGGEIWTFDYVDFNQEFFFHEDWGALIPDGADGVPYIYAYNKIANTDCKSRYFIQWETRYGGIQCQPFSLNSEYSENISTTKITNIIDEERPINKQITSSWSLNSRYLNDVEIKTFEDLYIAPRVWLIDVEKQMRIPVIVNDSKYVEKQFKNDRKLFNLSLKVSANIKQNIIY